jgi:hypothetical protein
LREHRLDRATHLESVVREPVFTSVSRGSGDQPIVVRHLERALDGVGRDVEGLGDRVADGALAHADPHLPEDEAREVVRLRWRGAVEQPEQRVFRGALAALARGGGDGPEFRVDVRDREGIVAAAGERAEAALPAEV